ncbi:MAG: redoxin domain-containing protein [Planctomycetaceae bacterium]|nr:redoxin domain-containing protein [Planctomycetaceae bacterium]
MRRNWIGIPLIMCGAWSMLLAGQARAAERVAGAQESRLANFELRDYRGKTWSLEKDAATSKLVVVAFLGTDCPLVKLYAGRLEELANEYRAQGVTFIGINSNRQDAPTKIAAQAQQLGLTFPILKDPDNRVADQFAAERTPELFVLDANRAIRYRGRVDDQYGFSTGVGYAKKGITRRDLVAAIDDLLAGREVAVARTEAPGCLIGRVPKVEPHGDITYSNQIARLLNNRCVQCHRAGQIGPMPLTTYDEVLGWGEMMREVVNANRMPPWHANPEHGSFSNDASLTKDEKDLLSQWVENGCPEGDRRDLPPAANFAEGWGIPTPDVVLPMADKPYVVQAEGTVEYQYFTVDPGFTEDKWIRGFEARPGNYAVVHHIICFVQPAGASDEDGRRMLEGAQIGYAPGMQPRMYPPGYALKIKAGSKIVFQMHYTAVGTEQPDLSSLGLIFADPREVKFEVRGGTCGNVSFEIPPHAKDFAVTADHKLRKDVWLMSMMPHMHVRGTAFRYDVTYPDGREEVLLDVPQYDFNWQLWYDVSQPKRLPAGTVLRCRAVYDNSEDNVYNPDPNSKVRFGDQTWEEMMFGFYTVIIPLTDEPPGENDFAPRAPLAAAARLEAAR